LSGQDQDFKDRTVLVTGADGFIGSHLAEALSARGARVTALSLYDAFGNRGWLDTLEDETLASIKIVRGDIRDASFVSRLVKGHDVVFHLAALIAIPHSYDSPHAYVDTNVGGTLNILEAARAHGAGRVVHTSTSEVYGTAQFTPITEQHPLQGQSPYSASKIGADMMAEAYTRSFGLPVVTLRPFNTYGPRQSERAIIPSVIRQALDPARTEIGVGDISPKRDFTFVDDTVRAFICAASADLDYGVPYNCGSGRAVTIGDVVDRIVKLSGCNKPTRHEPGRVRPDKSEVRELLADATRFSAATDWRPTTDLDSGLAATIEWWRDRISRGTTRRSVEYLT